MVIPGLFQMGIISTNRACRHVVPTKWICLWSDRSQVGFHSFACAARNAKSSSTGRTGWRRYDDES